MAKAEDSADGRGYRRRWCCERLNDRAVRVNALTIAFLIATMCIPAFVGSSFADARAAALTTRASAARPVSPTPIANRRPRAPLPLEGWTSFSHWNRTPSGHVTLQMYQTPEFRPTNGRWSTIDTTVHGRADPAFPYSAESAIRPVRFGVKSAAIVELALDAGVVTISAPSLTLGHPHPDARGVTYQNVAHDTDLTFVVANGQIQEQFILHSAAAPKQFTFHISDPKHALGSLRRLPDGSYMTSGRFDNDIAIGFAAPAAFEQREDTSSFLAAASSNAHLVATPEGRRIR